MVCHCALRRTACHREVDSHIRECSKSTSMQVTSKACCKAPAEHTSAEEDTALGTSRTAIPLSGTSTDEHPQVQHARMQELTFRPQPPARQQRKGHALACLLGAARPNAPRPTAALPSARNALAHRCTQLIDPLRLPSLQPPTSPRAPRWAAPRSLPARQFLHLLLGLAGQLREAHAHARGVLHELLAAPLHALRAPAARAPLSAPAGRHRAAASLHVRA